MEQLVEIKNARLVVVELDALGKRQIGEISIIAVLADDGAAAREGIFDALCERALAAAACAANTDDDHENISPIVTQSVNPLCKGIVWFLSVYHETGTLAMRPKPSVRNRARIWKRYLLVVHQYL